MTTGRKVGAIAICTVLSVSGVLLYVHLDEYCQHKGEYIRHENEYIEQERTRKLLQQKEWELEREYERRETELQQVEEDIWSLVQEERRTLRIEQVIALQAIGPSGVGAPVWPQALVALQVATDDSFALEQQDNSNLLR
jgi:hypothetical protein